MCGGTRELKKYAENCIFQTSKLTFKIRPWKKQAMANGNRKETELDYENENGIKSVRGRNKRERKKKKT